ncbi:MAG: RsmE family RNA methyltransferase [Nitrospinota bacterium]|nr:RsmE family RNA methyltransferase [Nitrospinota bacterium]
MNKSLRLFYTEEKPNEDKLITIGGDEAHHIREVLRMQSGEECRVGNSNGQEYFSKIESITKEKIVLRVVDEIMNSKKSSIRISLGIPLIKGDRFEKVLEKGTELGVDIFYPLTLERCEVRIPEKRKKQREERWNRIIYESSRQCNRIPPPIKKPLLNLEEFIFETRKDDLKIFGYIGENQQILHDALRIDKSEKRISISVLTGPEGDLSPNESERVIQAGFIPVSLGPRILRADTAPISIISIIQYTLGEMP